MNRVKRLLTLGGGVLGSNSGGGVAPVPLLPFTDLFTRADGDMGNGWEYTAGKWAVAGNAAAGTPGLGAELLVNGDFSAWSGDNPNGWSVSGESTPNTEITQRGPGQSHASGPAGTGLANMYTSAFAFLRLNQSVLTSGNWYRLGITIDTLTSGYLEMLDSTASIYKNISVPGTSIVTGRTTNNIYRLQISQVGTDITLGNATAKQIILADMFCTRDLGSANIDLSVPLTLGAGRRAGMVLCLDSIASPANFIIATHDGTNAMLTKCVAGMYTPLISAAAAYAAGRVLRVVKNGTTVQLFYNGFKIGTDQTVADAGIISNTRHGLFSTDAASVIDSFTAVAV